MNHGWEYTIEKTADIGRKLPLVFTQNLKLSVQTWNSIIPIELPIIPCFQISKMANQDHCNKCSMHIYSQYFK